MSFIDPAEAPDAVTRREFTVQSVLALLSGFIITISEACGSDGGPTPVTTSSVPATSTSSSTSAPTTSTAPATSTTSVPADINGTISANHGHIAVVTGAQVAANVAVTLNIQGNATHNHTVGLTPTDLTSLKSRQAVSITSSTDSGHMHTVTFTPA